MKKSLCQRYSTLFTYLRLTTWQSINQSNYFIVRLKVDQKAGQHSLASWTNCNHR